MEQNESLKFITEQHKINSACTQEQNFADTEIHTDTKAYTAGHRERVKERFLNTDFTGWQDYEILEFALFFVIPQKDTKQTAKLLIEKFGSLKELMCAGYNELSEAFKNIKGVGRHTALFLYFLKSFAVKYSEFKIKEKQVLSSPDSVVNFLRNLIGTSKNENFYAVFFNASNEVLDYKLISEGTAGGAAAYPAKIAKFALTTNARSVIVSHNHPGGICSPSEKDVSATKRIKQALEAVNVFLMDHIIVTDSGYFSFKFSGLL